MGVGKGNFIKLNGDALENLGVPIFGQRYVESIKPGTKITFNHCENEWYNVFMSPWVIAIHVFLVLISGASFSVAIVRMMQFVLIDGLKITIPKVGIAIEIVANIFRLAWCIPDPHGYLFFLPGWYDEVFKVYYTLFSNISNLLIVLYWHESMTSLSLEVTPYLQRMAIPFYVLASMLVFSETLLSVVRIALFPKYDLAYTLYATAVFHTSANVSIIIYLIIISYKLWKRLRQSKSGSNGMITRLLIRVISSLIIMVGLVVQAASFIIFPAVRTEPLSKLAYWSMAVINFNALSVIQVLSFLPSRVHRKTSSKMSGNTSNKSNVEMGSVVESSVNKA